MSTPHPSPFAAAFDARLSQSRSRFMVGRGGSLSYGALAERVARLTTLFARLGLAPSDRVVVASRDDCAVVSLFLALLRNGLTVVPLNPEARPAELARLVEAADPRALFLDQALDGVPEAQLAGRRLVRIRPDALLDDPLRALLDRLRPLAADAPFPDLLRGCAPTDAAPAFDRETTAYIIFTSGTTSRPKGVEISHRNLAAQMAAFARHYRLDADARIFNVLPLHHADGITQGAVLAFWVGGTILSPLRLRIDRVGELMERLHALDTTHLVAVPSMLSLLLDLGAHYRDAFRRPAFRFVVSTAAYLDANLWARFEETFGTRVVNVYGLTETVCEICYCGPDDATRRLGTVGKPVDAEVRVLDDDDRALPPGAPGELWLKGEQIMKGYFRMPAETTAVMRDGWFRTGDLATIDADGFVRIVGRKKDVISTAGMNVYPEDVTGTLRAMPGVADAVTFGAPVEPWGEQVVSCVIPALGATLSEREIAGWFLAHASPEKLPREIHLFDELPRGPSGKFVMAEVRRLVEERRAVRQRDAHAGSVATRVVAVAAAAFKCDPAALALDASAETTPGWSSLAHVEFLIGLEAEFDLRLEPGDVMRIHRLADAVALIEAHAGAPCG